MWRVKTRDDVKLREGIVRHALKHRTRGASGASNAQQMSAELVEVVVVSMTGC